MTKDDLLQTEQEHQKRAFECYYALGEKRSYGRVAQEMGVSPSAVKLWSRSFGWRQRVQERDADVARKVADRAIQSNIDKLDRNQKIVQMALVKLAKGIADGKVRMQLGDLERLVRLQAFLDESGQQETNQTLHKYPDRLYQLLTESDAETLRAGIEVFKALSRGVEVRFIEPPPSGEDEGTESDP